MGMQRCPCRVNDEDHRALGASQREQQPLLFAAELSEDDHALVSQTCHAVAATRDTGAYVWCDQYFLSHNFSPGVRPPPCPAGPLALSGRQSSPPPCVTCVN